MSEFEQVEQPVDDKFKDRLKKAGCDEDKDVFDEGIFVSESNGEEDDEEDDNDFLRQPKTEFEKNLLRINNISQQIDEDTQFLSHDMVRRVFLLFSSVEHVQEFVCIIYYFNCFCTSLF